MSRLVKPGCAWLIKPPLPEANRRKLTEWFGHLLGVGLELPDHSSSKGIGNTSR